MLLEDALARTGVEIAEGVGVDVGVGVVVGVGAGITTEELFAGELLVGELFVVKLFVVEWLVEVMFADIPVKFVAVVLDCALSGTTPSELFAELTFTVAVFMHVQACGFTVGVGTGVEVGSGLGTGVGIGAGFGVGTDVGIGTGVGTATGTVMVSTVVCGVSNVSALAAGTVTFCATPVFWTTFTTLAMNTSAVRSATIAAMFVTLALGNTVAIKVTFKDRRATEDITLHPS